MTGSHIHTAKNEFTDRVIAIIGESIYHKDERFWNNTVITDNNCIELLTTHGTKNGYKMTKRDGSIIMSHRYAYKLLHGKVPDKLGCHSCDNRGCINPFHIEDKNQSSNLIEAVLKGRNASQKFSVAEVKQIREDVASGKVRQIDLVRKYKVSSATISDIVNYVKWWYI